MASYYCRPLNRVITIRDGPGALPRSCYRAGAKSPVDRPYEYYKGNVSITPEVYERRQAVSTKQTGSAARS